MTTGSADGSPSEGPELPPGEPVPVGPFDPAGASPQRNLAMLLIILGAFAAIMGVAAIGYFASSDGSSPHSSVTTTTQP